MLWKWGYFETKKASLFKKQTAISPGSGLSYEVLCILAGFEILEVKIGGQIKKSDLLGLRLCFTMLELGRAIIIDPQRAESKDQ